MKRLCSILLGCAFLTGSLLSGSVADADDLPQVRPDGRRLTFGWHGGSPHKIDVSNLIRATSLSEAKVLDAKRIGEVDYFLVRVTGPSREGAADNSIGSGTESNLIWLKLKSWHLLDAQSMLYQSFWDSLEPVGDYHKIAGVLTIRYENKRESTNYVLRYDSARPDGKIEIKRASDMD